MLSDSNSEWFKDWFNSPYYHILYKNRSFVEADLFISNLANYFSFKKEDIILDLGCGKGRHSFSLNKYAERVIGLDLASESIKEANAIKGNALYPDFRVGDMRSFQIEFKFDYILNLFTSFGYFDSLVDNQNVIDTVAKHLEEEGIFVMDYLNSEKVRQNGPSEEVKVIDGIEFQLKKTLDANFVYKNIEFEINSKKYNFTERVQLFEIESLQKMFEKSSFSVIENFGDYNLNPYFKDSDRMILVGKKETY
jgi:SAM-dependent methyltransferase